MQRRTAAANFDPKGASRSVFVVVCAIFVLVAAKLVYLQVIDSANLAARAQARTNTVPLSAKRGAIYDRNGNVLAMSVDCKTVYCNPQEIHDIQGTAKVLAECLGGEPSDYMDSLTTNSTFAYVKMRIDSSVAEDLQAALRENEVTGIHLLADTKRVYPYGSVGAQVLGVVDAEGHGATGLEYYYDDVLSGTDGSLLMEAGADGTPVAGGASEEIVAKDGTAIVISLDIDIQRAAESALANGVKDSKAESGFAVVMDPDSGEVFAACSTPSYDPTDLANASNEAMSLKPVVNSYELGSVFKTLTMAIGMEKGLLSADTSFYVPPTVQVGDDTVTDDDDRNYSMDMTVREIMRRSSNTGAVLMGETVGARDIHDGFAGFLIGTATGIDYGGESAGLVTPYENWNGATLGATSFGQGFAVPPIQLVRAFAAIANDGTLVTPHFLVAREHEVPVVYERKEAPISKETCDKVDDILRTVVEEGTAELAQIDGYDIVGKTGTGEIADTTYGGYKYGLYTSSFVGYTPEGSQRVMGYLGLYETSLLASDSACPAWAEMMNETLHAMGIQPSKPITQKTESSDTSESDYDEYSYDDYSYNDYSYDEGYEDESYGY